MIRCPECNIIVPSKGLGKHVGSNLCDIFSIKKRSGKPQCTLCKLHYDWGTLNIHTSSPSHLLNAARIGQVTVY